MRVLLLVFLVVVTSGCARGMYNWGGYNSHLYSYYQDPTSAENFINVMERHINRLEATSEKPAPGLYAELGTLYLQKGDRQRAIEFYSKEKNAWPESESMMQALITNLDTNAHKE